MATIKGKALVWSVNGISFTAGIVTATAGSAAFQSSRIVRSSDTAEVKDSNGEVVSKVFFNPKKTFTVTAVPTATSIANAQASGDAWLPAPGTLITAVDSDGTIVDGDYNVLTATQTRTNDGAMAVELELEKFDNNNVTTTAS